jgi:glutamate-1-semialdehyde 2,1-aminomutase
LNHLLSVENICACFSFKAKTLKNAIMDKKLIDCLRMQERAKKLIPGMTQLLSKRPDMFSLGVWPGYFSKAAGVVVWDLDGNEYIDMSISGIGANVLGYCDPDVDAAVFHAVKNGSSSSLNCPEEVELAEVLVEVHPWADMARFARTGGEAMAVAVRIARAYTGRDKIAFCGYHGWHDWYLAANLETENALGDHLLPGLDPKGVPRGLAGTMLPFRYNHIDDLETIVSKHKTEIAAVVMEPIRSVQPEAGFLERVRELSTESGAVFILDEISAGFRMCVGGAHLVLGVNPDIAVFSKALGNGYPIAAIIGKGQVMAAAQSTFISSSYWTERIGPSAALAVIRKFRDEEVHKRLMTSGTAVQEGWNKLAQKHGLVIHVTGIPPLSHFAFEGEDSLAMKALFIQFMLDRSFLASNLFYAMYAHAEEHVEAYLNAVNVAFAEIADAVKKDDLQKRLKGQPSSAGFKRLI